jgi:hypothetical protein
VRGMTEDTKVFGGLFKRSKLPKELLFSQFLLGKAAFAFVVGVHEIFHLMLLLVGLRSIVYIHDLGRRSG